MGSVTILAKSYTSEEISQKHKSIIEKASISKSQTGVEDRKYKSLVIFKDQYDNILRMNSKWWGNKFCVLNSFSNKIDYKLLVKRTGYKDLTVNVDLKEGQEYIQNAVFELNNISNIVMGTVDLPKTQEYKNIYIELVDNSNQATAYLKVHDQNWFKCYNIADGTYTLKVVQLNLGNDLEVERTLYTEDITIKGNYKNNIIVNEVAADLGFKNLKPVDFFNTIDYEQAKTYIKTNPILFLSDEAKADIKSKIKEGKNDIDTIKNIMRYINNNYHDSTKPNDYEGWPITSPMETYNKGYGSDCSEFAQFFEAICAIYDIKTVQLHGISTLMCKDRQSGNTNWIGGHIFVEAYVKEQDKWVLVDPTAGFLTEQYNKDCLTIRADSSTYKNDYIYIIRKSINSTWYFELPDGRLKWSDHDVLPNIMDNFDLSLVDYEHCNYSTTKQNLR